MTYDKQHLAAVLKSIQACAPFTYQLLLPIYNINAVRAELSECLCAEVEDHLDTDLLDPLGTTQARLRFKKLIRAAGIEEGSLGYDRLVVAAHQFDLIELVVEP